jgi:hypothetical protein
MLSNKMQTLPFLVILILSLYFFICELSLSVKVYGGGMRPEDWTDHWSKIVSSSSVGGNSAENMDVDAS